MTSTTLLLPARARLAQQRLPPALAVRLARAERAFDATHGHGLGQLGRVLDVLPRTWPVAAATRQRDAGDAVGAAWLRADPAYVRPDINGARLLAHGPALALDLADVDAFLSALRPLFGDAGVPIDAPDPSRWYLRLPAGAKWPAFVPPDMALGDDVFDHLPGASADQSGEGRRWRALLSEAQVVLHNHPCNAERLAKGLAPVNSLWFWGAGVLPGSVRTAYTSIATDDDALEAMALLADVATAALPTGWSSTPLVNLGSSANADSALFDLRHVRDLAALERDWLAPLHADLQAGRLQRATLDFADGHAFVLTPGQRWRFWRRALGSLEA
ncbi:hypothetical protein N800_08225 [Lysobacter daejeonensis GH1-9]|uniref:Phosphoglycerate mutase n=1 Tax=Lysobacter daejeonensis GH1-9 TaxID=1385517 RepID=A0A0A0F1J6_9GAMM|nr:hypothetical protein [Lysobacter daejeonensis]KGM56193.1 hypothetical protein N800_08225 [Lysobacter daejeonensis GH1-9]